MKGRIFPIFAAGKYKLLPVTSVATSVGQNIFGNLSTGGTGRLRTPRRFQGSGAFRHPRLFNPDSKTITPAAASSRDCFDSGLMIQLDGKFLNRVPGSSARSPEEGFALSAGGHDASSG